VNDLHDTMSIYIHIPKFTWFIDIYYDLNDLKVYPLQKTNSLLISSRLVYFKGNIKKVSFNYRTLHTHFSFPWQLSSLLHGCTSVIFDQFNRNSFQRMYKHVDRKVSLAFVICPYNYFHYIFLLIVIDIGCTAS
jgi:hypothetical protein